MTLGERIREYRQAAGLSQEGLAEKLHVSRQAITKWETDGGVPDIDNLISLSRAMGLSLDELVTGESFVPAAKADNCGGALRLIAAVGFSVAGLCWLVSMLLNLANGNEAAAVLSGINLLLLALPIGVLLKKR